MHPSAGAIVFLLTVLAPSLGFAMTFEPLTAEACAPRTCLLAQGPIDRDSLEQFRAYVRASDVAEGAIVFVGSPGGDIVTAIALGKEIRRRGLNTFVGTYAADRRAFAAADCASACVSMFMGGVQRGVGRGSRLGVHQVEVASDARLVARNAQWFMGLISEHFTEMGADPQMLTMALKTPAEGMRWMSRQELRQGRAITLDNDVTKPSAGLGALSFFDAVR